MRFDIVPLIEALGIEPLDQVGLEIIARCPSHDDTGKPNWSINVSTGQHHCWSCNYGGSLMGLIADQQDLTWPDGEPDLMAALVWARRFRSDDLTAITELRKYETHPGAAKTRSVVIREPDLALFHDVPAWALESRRLTAEAARTHGVRWSNRQDSWITVIRDPWTHHLRGWQVKSELDRSFRNYPVGVDKHSTLFGLEAFTGGTAVLMESPLDVVRLASSGHPGGLATYGAAISHEQLSVLTGYADEVIIAMDNPAIDAAGKAATLRLVRELTRRMPTRVLDYDHTKAKDIGDMTDEQIHRALAGARGGWLGTKAVHS